MSIDTGYTNPIDLLKLILTYQNNGDNATGEASSTARIRSGTGVNGSFDSTTLDILRSINVYCQIDEISKGSTDTLIDTICKMFNLVQYTDSEGYECVKYLFAEGSDVPIRLFSIDENTSIENFNAPDPAKICVNPIIKYAYNYGIEKFTRELKIDNVQTGTYIATHVSGFENTDGETYWNKCFTMLWPLVRHIEDMDSEWSENEFIADYAGAKFRLDNVIKLMRACTMDFTVPFTEGCLTESGDIIEISFPHLSLAGDTVFDAVVTGITKSKGSNNCNISVMFIGNSSPFELMDTADENTFPLIDSYDPQPLQINNSYLGNGAQSFLTYVDPAARNCHITQINDDLTTLLAEMDPCQIGIATNITGKPFLYTDDENNFHYFNTGIGTTGKILQYIDGPHGITGDSIIIQKDNKIGIGTENPSGNLHLNDSTGVCKFVLSDINTGEDHGLELTVMSLTHTYDTFKCIDKPSILYGNMAWLTKDKDRINLGYLDHPELSPVTIYGAVNTTGNVAIGKSTIPTWLTSFRALQIGGTYGMASPTAEQNNNETYTYLNMYNDGTNWKPFVSGVASMLKQGGSGNSFMFYLNSGLTAGVAFAPTPVAEINSSSVIIGKNTTGPQAAPYSLNLGKSYSNSATKDKCKIRIYDDGAGDVYGFSIGGNGDVQYHASSPTLGNHAFYVDNTNRFSVIPTGANIPAGSYLNCNVTAGAIGNTTTAYASPLQILQPTVETDAFMSFHIGGDYACYFGLDGTTNDLFVGGWSMGGYKHKIWHAGNDGSGSGLDADALDGLHSSAFAQTISGTFEATFVGFTVNQMMTVSYKKTGAIVCLTFNDILGVSNSTEFYCLTNAMPAALCPVGITIYTAMGCSVITGAQQAPGVLLVEIQGGGEIAFYRQPFGAEWNDTGNKGLSGKSTICYSV